MSKTTLIKDKDIKRQWHEIDAKDKSLGRLASLAAKFLSGKHKVLYSPHQDLGDFVVVKNVKNIKLSARAKNIGSKKYYRYSGYPGGLRSVTLEKKFATDPAEVVRRAIREMLDDNRLRSGRMNRLKIILDEKHNYPITRNT